MTNINKPVIVRVLGREDDGTVQIVQPENFASFTAFANRRGGLNMWDIHEAPTLTTDDPYTTAVVTDSEGDEIAHLDFDFYAETEAEWNRLADKAIIAAGLMRVSAWKQDGSRLTTSVAPAPTPAK